MSAPSRLAVPLLAALLFGVSPARAERVVVSLSENEIAIGSNYTGTRLALFGVVERDDRKPAPAATTDVVVTVRGPRESMTVRQKERVGPLWINRSQQKFVAVPTVLGVATSRPLSEIATPAVRRRLRLGLAEIVHAPEMTFEQTAEQDPFREALIRLKTKEGLWRQDMRGVVFVADGFFRAAVPIPATAPTGNYEVEVVILSGEKLVARRVASFEVVKKGFEERISYLSQDRSFLYAFLIGILSLGFGWVASVIFRRD
ncbi:TIGR02186 family protein [Enterovirga sp.]|uniref:TIGR02186 family protein n=1 Tax=Enterovirga sp. TaxID=2026350 RepID=UPI002BC786C8|nr:TIGR02186 family protein [Enterovirga sp.]HMO28063.1 TIGR02186 family protein [Enterovirga sp.]